MHNKLYITPLSKWFSSGKAPLIVSGPCSAESEEQLLLTANLLAEIKSVNIFRAGVWKPRTRPNCFEGIGLPALKWLKTVKQQTGLAITVEVANAYHIEQCLRHDIDILWIGARTTVNPFYVQEIANALKGTDIPVMVKNPLHPDLSLWIGALERLNQAGISKLIAVHRGFFSYKYAKYRNIPHWNLPIELKSKYPDLPVLCDPSHICGNTNLIPEIAQTAIDLAFDGLMIESHHNPGKALSDKNQQITPSQLRDLLSSLSYKSKGISDIIFKNVLDDLRLEVDEVDFKILRLLASRMDLISKIGEYKKENKVTILQIKRWRQILSSRTDFAEKLDLDARFIYELLNIIHKESIRKQTNIFNQAVLEKV